MASVASEVERSSVPSDAERLATAVLAQLQRLFRRLRQADIPFCILRNRDRIPAHLVTGSDVDLIVPVRTSVRQVIDALAGLRPVQIMSHRSTIELYFRVGPIFLHVDLLVGDRQWRGANYLSNEKILLDAEEDRGMPVASLVHQAFCAWFSSLTRVRHFKPRYIPLIKQAAHQFPAEFRGLLCNSFGQQLGDDLWELIEHDRLEDSDQFAARCRRAIWWRGFWRSPFTTLAGAVHHYWCEARQYVQPAGLNVAIVGSDGSGKSAACAALANAPRASLPFRHVETCHLYRRVLPMLSELRKGRWRRTPANPVAVHDPHGKRPHHGVVSIFTLIYFAVDQWLSRIRWTWPKLTKNSLLIQDRHLSEILVDPKRFRYGGPQWLARWVIRCIPKPDLVILLDAPAEVLHQRKQEVPLAETARQRDAYWSMISGITGGTILDATPPMEHVAAQVKSTILRHVARRTSRRFSLQSGAVDLRPSEGQPRGSLGLPTRVPKVVTGDSRAQSLGSETQATVARSKVAAPASAPLRTPRPTSDKSQLKTWVGRGTWGLADQSLISATNFVTMVLLARGLGPMAFGKFVLVYTIMQFANSLQSALVLQPHNVLGATRVGRDYVNYTASSAAAQALFSAILCVPAAIAAGWAVAFSTEGMLLVALMPTMIAWQFQEFARRVLYTEVRIAAAFANDLVSYGGQTVAIAGLWWTSQLTGPLALLAIGTTSAIAAAIGCWQVRQSLWGRIQRSVFRDNWRFGKWLAGAEIGYWLSSQMYLFLTGFMLGPAAAGIMKAGYVLFGPARIIGFFLRTALPTWFSRTLASDGKQALDKHLRLVYWISLPILGAYSIVIAAFAGPVLRLLYGDEYAGHELVVVLYAVFAFVAFLASVVSAALRAQQRSRHIFFTQLLATLTLPAGWLLIKFFGIPGAVLGMILTSAVVNLSFWWAYRRDLHQEAVSEVALATGELIRGDKP